MPTNKISREKNKTNSTKTVQNRAPVELKDLATLANALSGIVGMSLAIAGNQLAAAYIIPAILFDFLDGKIARKQSTANEFGKQLDSLADVVSFLVAPAVLIMLKNPPTPLLTAAAALYVAVGLLRLAWFNLQKEKGTYKGLPTPIAAVAAVAVNYFAPEFNAIALIILSVLMIAPFKLKKL